MLSNDTIEGIWNLLSNDTMKEFGIYIYVNGTMKEKSDVKNGSIPGTWFGVELDRPAGKNNGAVGGVQYFTCRPKHGVFAPLSRIQK